MPCITVIIPRLDITDEGVKRMEDSIIGGAILDPEFGLKPDNVWVYVLSTTSFAPASKVTIEALDMPERPPAMMQKFARVVGDSVRIACRQMGLVKSVVVYTHRQNRHDGFFETIDK